MLTELVDGEIDYTTEDFQRRFKLALDKASKKQDIKVLFKLAFAEVHMFPASCKIDIQSYKERGYVPKYVRQYVIATQK